MNMSTAVVRTVHGVVIVFCLLVSISCKADDTYSCSLLSNLDEFMCCIPDNACENDSLVEEFAMRNMNTTYLTNNSDVSSGSLSGSGCNLTLFNFADLEIANYTCNCTNQTVCISVNSSMTTITATTEPPATTSMDTTFPSTIGNTTVPATTEVHTTEVHTTEVHTTEVPTTEVPSTEVTSESTTRRTSKTDPDYKPATELPALWLWVGLGVLLILIICVLAVIILFITVACCRRHHKRKEPSTMMDIVSKWEDVPDESSDIKLVSIKSIGDDDDKDGEKENNGDVAKSEETKKDGSGGDKEEKKDGDITLGTFGFPEVVVEPTAFKAENTGDKETEKKEGDGNEGNTADKKEQKGKEISDKDVKKSVDESTTSNTGATICGTSADKQNTTTTTEAVIPQLPLQEETKPEPVPVNIPTFGNQQKEEQALISGSGLSTSADKTDQSASPAKQQALSTEVSNASKEMTINAKVSTDTEPAGTTEPQAQTADVQPLLSDKTSDGTGGLLSFEDIEKALGLVVKDVDQDASMQM